MPRDAVDASGLLGVLGGMGPLATADFLRKLIQETPASRDQDHIPCVIMNDPRIPDRSDAILDSGPSPLPTMLALMERLVATGATAIAVPCNSAHFWVQDLRTQCRVPLISVIDAVLHDIGVEVAGRPAIRVGVMGTSGTLQAGIYQRCLADAGMDPLVPTDAEMQDWVTPGILAVKGGQIARAKTLLMTASERLVARGAAVIVLACTEIPVVIADDDLPGVSVVDSTAALARACVRYFRGADAAAFGSRQKIAV